MHVLLSSYELDCNQYVHVYIQADNTPPSDNSGSGSLSTDVFIAVISSVCAVIFLLALLMICSFIM